MQWPSSSWRMNLCQSEGLRFIAEETFVESVSSTKGKRKGLVPQALFFATHGKHDYHVYYNYLANETYAYGSEWDIGKFRSRDSIDPQKQIIWEGFQTGDRNAHSPFRLWSDAHPKWTGYRGGPPGKGYWREKVAAADLHKPFADTPPRYWTQPDGIGQMTVVRECVWKSGVLCLLVNAGCNQHKSTSHGTHTHPPTPLNPEHPHTPHPHTTPTPTPNTHPKLPHTPPTPQNTHNARPKSSTLIGYLQAIVQSSLIETLRAGGEFSLVFVCFFL